MAIQAPAKERPESARPHLNRRATPRLHLIESDGRKGANAAPFETLTLAARHRIVMMLEEAGAETIGTVIATLKASNQKEFSVQRTGR